MRQLRERVAASVWVRPAVIIIAFLVAGTVLAQYAYPSGSTGALLTWPADVASARSLLSSLATASVTVTGLTFSLAVVALQLASTQFSPRLLRTFSADPVVQDTLGVLLGTFAYSLVVLRSVGGSERAVPQPALSGALLCGLLTIGFLVRFLAHLITLLRVDTMLAAAHDEASTLLRTLPEQGSPDALRALPERPATAVAVRAPTSGFVQEVREGPLVRWAEEHSAVVRLDVVPGDHVLAGDTVGWVWGRGLGGVDVLEPDEWTLRLGRERTPASDLDLGFRQLADVGVKAMSPGINDPTTAVHVVGHLAALLAEATTRHLGPVGRTAGDGTLLLARPERSAADLVRTSCAQLRRFGAHEPAVLLSLLDLCGSVARRTRDPDVLGPLTAEAQRILRAAGRALPEPDDLADVRHRGAATLAALGAAAARARST